LASIKHRTFLLRLLEHATWQALVAQRKQRN
jgi:hypothetical protein